MKAGKVIVLAVTSLLMLATTHAQDSPKMKMTTDIPASIDDAGQSGDALGTLKLRDGYPDAATVEKVYDNLDFERGMQAYLIRCQARRCRSARGFRERAPWTIDRHVQWKVYGLAVAVSDGERGDGLAINVDRFDEWPGGDRVAAEYSGNR